MDDAINEQIREEGREEERGWKSRKSSFEKEETRAFRFPRTFGFSFFFFLERNLTRGKYETSYCVISEI